MLFKGASNHDSESRRNDSREGTRVPTTHHTFMILRGLYDPFNI